MSKAQEASVLEVFSAGDLVPLKMMLIPEFYYRLTESYFLGFPRIEKLVNVDVSVVTCKAESISNGSASHCMKSNDIFGQPGRNVSRRSLSKRYFAAPRVSHGKFSFVSLT